jgi:hypothetical protein
MMTPITVVGCASAHIPRRAELDQYAAYSYLDLAPALDHPVAESPEYCALLIVARACKCPGGSHFLSGN